MQCRQLADIALNAPAIERSFLLPKLGFPRARTAPVDGCKPLAHTPIARTDPKFPINLQCLGILSFRLPRFFGSVYVPPLSGFFYCLLLFLLAAKCNLPEIREIELLRII